MTTLRPDSGQRQAVRLRRLLERDPPDAGLLEHATRKARAEAAVIAAVEGARVTAGCPELPKELRCVLAAGLGRGFEAWLRERTSDAEGLVTRAGRPLGRARWELARGRRCALLLATVAPRGRGEPAWSRRRLVQALRRAWRLLRYWAPRSVRAWRRPRA